MGSDDGLAYLKAKECPFSSPSNGWKSIKRNAEILGISEPASYFASQAAGVLPDAASSAARLGYLIVGYVF